MLTFIQIPDVQPVTVFSAKQQLRVEAALDHIRGAPFGGDQGIVTEVPPEIVCKILRAAVFLPRSLQLERIGIHQEDSAGTVAAGRPERAAIDGVRATMNGVR